MRCVPAMQNEETPLYLASEHGCLEVVVALLAKGADVQAKTNVRNAHACALSPTQSLKYMQSVHGYQ